MTRTSAVLWMLATLMALCGRPIPGLADGCDQFAPGNPACVDNAAPPPPRRWVIPQAVAKPPAPDIVWSATIPGWTTAGPQGRELVRFPAPGWPGTVHLYLHGIPTSPPTPVSCTVELRKLDGTVICEVETTAETVGNKVECAVSERILAPVPIRVVLTEASGGSCHMGGGWWAAPNP